jgi:transcription elongation factor Elf1
MIDTYNVTVECVNCGYQEILEIRKGIKVIDAYCPYCGCYGTLKYMCKA